MIVISHRGNISGPNEITENTPEQITKAIQAGYNVEVDVWSIDSEFFLGHDEPKHKAEVALLSNPNVWCHAKNISALLHLQKINAHFFWHQNDDIALTSNGYLWTYPEKKLTKNSICVMPETFDFDISKIMLCHGICTDYPEKFKTLTSKEV